MMAVFVIPFTNPPDYTFNSGRYNVAGGLANLKESLLNIHARWHLNEASGATTADDGPNNYPLSLVNTPSRIAGKLGNAIQFAATQYLLGVDSALGDFDSDDPLAIEFWLKTSAVSGSIIAKRGGTPAFQGWDILINSGKLRINWSANNPTNDRITMDTASSVFGNNTYYHIVINYDGSKLASGFELYANAVSQPFDPPIIDNLSGSVLTGAKLNVAARNNGDSDFVGVLDEIVIYDRELTPAEIAYRYNAGIGREDWYYFTDGPSIFKTAGDTDPLLTAWTNFVVTVGPNNAATWTFQLSEDGVNWKHWNGSAWVAATTEYNTEATVNANISAFPTATKTIYVRAFSVSTGLQLGSIDEIQVGYSDNQAPVVDAGTNKTTDQNNTISPFSDCSFSDPDGTVDHAYYKVDGEVDVWTEIPQGAFGTLLEAVQAFQYQFANFGDLTVRLQVEDNGGTKSDDSLIVTVNKYTTNWTVKDNDGNHFTYVSVELGDGSPAQLLDSPFTLVLPYGESHVHISKPGYVGREIDVFVTIQGQSFNVVLDQFLTREDIGEIADEVANRVRQTDVDITTDTDEVSIETSDENSVTINVDEE
jgi:hypothetical protein